MATVELHTANGEKIVADSEMWIVAILLTLNPATLNTVFQNVAKLKASEIQVVGGKSRAYAPHIIKVPGIPSGEKFGEM